MHLDVIGDGPERAELERAACALGLQGHVTFHGYLTEDRKRDVIEGSWLHVIGSQSEGWGLTVLEAAERGVPTLAVDVPGIRDAVRDGETGWLVPDPAALAPSLDARIRQLADAREAERVGDAARVWASSFSWDASARRLARVLDSERSRRSRDGAERRRGNDLVTRIDIPMDTLPRGASIALRKTDTLTRAHGNAVLLVAGADEHDALGVLDRLGVPADYVTISVARKPDVLMSGGAPAHLEAEPVAA